ncbi:MAG: isoprenyl transferase [Eubacteriales bacterium]|nr:isoprenyl transferase [Eubacteriales bacterium]
MEQQALPRHIAFIMDGNGRWAKKRGLPRTAGHRAGTQNVMKIVEHCGDLGIECVTFYAFSTENWSRPAAEVNALMSLLGEFLEKNLMRLHTNGVRIRILGEASPRFGEALTATLHSAVELTKNNTKMILNVALNYGGRAEIVRAFKAMHADAEAGKLDFDAVDEKTVQDYLYTAGCPEPDLLIRTSGEQRISNFLLYQLAYTEFVFTPVSWPDFTPERLDEALRDFASRSRRFGGLDKESKC